MKLEKIGFYTLSDKRAKELNYNSSLKRAEILLNNVCNFNCVYCRDKKGDYILDLEDVYRYIDILADNDIENIRFSGGEPTMYKYLFKVIYYTKKRCNNIKNIAISTNGSGSYLYYKDLVDFGVTDFSISLDSCCSDIANKMAGKNIDFKNICNNIKGLSKLCNVTIGVVLNEKNINDVQEIIKFCDGLNPSDIRIIPSAQFNNKLYNFDIDKKILNKYPILKYRINNIKKNKLVRGLTKKDNNKCPLILDDLAIRGNYHYPCIIKLREGCNPIGEMDYSIRFKRYEYYKEHNVYDDEICRKNCLDVCVDYNNKVKKVNKNVR